MRYEFNDGSAIIFKGRSWVFGLPEDELKILNIQRRFKELFAQEVQIALQTVKHSYKFNAVTARQDKYLYHSTTMR